MYTKYIRFCLTNKYFIQQMYGIYAACIDIDEMNGYNKHIYMVKIVGDTKGKYIK